MIKVTTSADTIVAGNLLFAMYNEVFPDICSEHIVDYVEYIESCEHVYIGDEGECLLIVKDVTPKLLNIPTLWDGEAVYIIPNKRKGKLLKEMYDFMFETFEGNFVGMVNKGSEHESVVAKRGEFYGTTYIFNKDTFGKDK